MWVELLYSQHTSGWSTGSSGTLGWYSTETYVHIYLQSLLCIFVQKGNKMAVYTFILASCTSIAAQLLHLTCARQTVISGKNSKTSLIKLDLLRSGGSLSSVSHGCRWQGRQLFLGPDIVNLCADTDCWVSFGILNRKSSPLESWCRSMQGWDKYGMLKQLLSSLIRCELFPVLFHSKIVQWL